MLHTYIHTYVEVHDDRKYDSDNEVYDSHDRTVTLALGTMVSFNSFTYIHTYMHTYSTYTYIQTYIHTCT